VKTPPNLTFFGLLSPEISLRENTDTHPDRHPHRQTPTQTDTHPDCFAIRKPQWASICICITNKTLYQLWWKCNDSRSTRQNAQRYRLIAVATEANTFLQRVSYITHTIAISASLLPCLSQAVTFSYSNQSIPRPELATRSISTVFSAWGRGFVFSFFCTSVILYTYTTNILANRLHTTLKLLRVTRKLFYSNKVFCDSAPNPWSF